MRQLLSAGPIDEEDTASQQSEDTPAWRSEREQIKRDLLMGHLLSLATQNSPAGLPSHALPALAASLSGKGLMPKWVQWSLTHQPALFNKAFESLFCEVRGVLPMCQCIAATCTAWLQLAMHCCNTHRRFGNSLCLCSCMALQNCMALQILQGTAEMRELSLHTRSAPFRMPLAVSKARCASFASSLMA